MTDECAAARRHAGSPREVAYGLSSAVHAPSCGDHPPAATMAGVAWLCDPAWKVEIEAEAVIAAPDAS